VHAKKPVASSLEELYRVHTRPRAVRALCERESSARAA
jgi:hypothetical protein